MWAEGLIFSLHKCESRSTLWWLYIYNKLMCIQGVAIWGKDKVAVIFISPSSQLLHCNYIHTVATYVHG